MRVKYYDDDALDIIASRGGDGGCTLEGAFDIIFTFEGWGSENVTGLLLLHASAFLPLDPARGYDPDTDTLTFGKRPEAGYRVVDNGDFVSYRHLYDDGGEEIAAFDLRQASKHLAPVLAASPEGHWEKMRQKLKRQIIEDRERYG